MLVLIIFFLNLLNANWEQEGDYLKINHGLEDVKHFRYSIDTTNFLIYDDTQLIYFDKYTGNVSQTYPKTFEKSSLEIFGLTFALSLEPHSLSINEKRWTYSLYARLGEDFNDVGYCIINKEKDSIISKRTVYDKDVYIVLSYSPLAIQFSDNKNTYFYYFSYNAVERDGGIDYKREGINYHFSYNYPSAKRIEDVAYGFKFNEYNYDVIVPLDDRIYRKGNYKYSIYKPFTSYSFANNETEILVQKFDLELEDKKIFRNYIYDSKNNDSSYIYSDTQFGNIYYLEDNKFITQLNKNTFAILDGVDFKEYHRFETPFEVSKSFYDSTNNEIYYLSKEFVYKSKINLNLNTINSNFICKSKADVDDIINFYNISTGKYDDVKWDFDDGTISFEVNPNHKFEYTGDYFVKLYLYKSDSIADVFERKISIYKELKAQFEYQILSDDKPFRIYFKNKTEGNVNKIRWFKNDSLFSEDNHPELVVDNYGTMKIRLEVENFNSIESYTETIALFPKKINNDFNFKVETKQGVVDLKYFGNDTFFFSNDIFNKIGSVHYGYISKDLLDTNTFFRTKNKLEGTNTAIEYDSEIELYKFNSLFQKINNKLYYFNFNILWEVEYHGKELYYIDYDFHFEKKVYLIDENNFSLVNNSTEKTYGQPSFYPINIENSFYIQFKGNLLKYDIDNNKFNDLNFKIPYLKYTININSNTDNIYIMFSKSILQLNTITLDTIFLNLKDNYYDNHKTVIDDDLYFVDAYNNELKIIKFDLFKLDIINEFSTNLTTVNKICKYNDGIILFGNTDNKLAYEIFEKGGSYLKEYDFNASFINAVLNDNEEFLSQIRVDGISNEDYLFISKIENFMNIEKDSKIIIGNSIPLKDKILEIELYSILGQSIEKSTNIYTDSYNISHLQKGIYLYKITYSNSIETGKILRD
jgi:hypothetical protein